MSHWSSPGNQVALWYCHIMLSLKPRFIDSTARLLESPSCLWWIPSPLLCNPWYFVYSSILLPFTLHCNLFTDLPSSKIGCISLEI